MSVLYKVWRQGVIRAIRLTKIFDGAVAVEGLTFEVARGELFALLGPNGAGKTTTVRMLACLIAPSSGEAVVNGYRVGSDDMAIRQSVGLLTESPGHYERLSAEDNLRIYARLYSVRDVDKQVQRYLKMFQLWDRRSDPVATFSKGMKQRLALARALMHEPATIFLDEPTAGLDPEAAKTVRDHILQLKKEGRTILLCTHNLDEAERLSDRIGILKRRLIAVDTTEALRRELFGRQIAIQLRNGAERFLPVVRACDFVLSARCEKDKLIAAVPQPETQNPLLVRRLVEAGAEIQSVTELRPSLEEIYLQIVRDENL